MKIPPAKLDKDGRWIYPQVYFHGHKKISKKKLVGETYTNVFVQEAIRVESNVGKLIEQAKNQRCEYGYNSVETFYDYYKPRISRLVGWSSPHKALRTQSHYDAVYDAIYHILPADETDLYEEGIMENGMFSPRGQEKYGREYP